jgi:hypothetical protein
VFTTSAFCSSRSFLRDAYFPFVKVVLQRTSLRSGSEEEQTEQEEVYTIQIVQLASLVVLLLAV